MHLDQPSSLAPGAAPPQRPLNSPLLYQALCALAISFATALGAPGAIDAARADESYALTLKDHRFTPAELTVPAGERFRIELENQDATPAEFESSEMKVEKFVVGGGKITLRIAPLKPGTYKFFDDYHPDDAKGTVTAVAPKP